MTRAFCAAIAATLVGLGTVSCGTMPGNPASAGASELSPSERCADLPQAEHDYCIRQSGGFIGWQPVPLDPKPSPSGY